MRRRLAFTMSDLDRSRPPAPQATRPFEFPQIERFHLANGIEVRVAPRQGLPLLHLTLTLPAGGERQERASAGLASLAAGLLDSGTRRRSATDIARHVEGLGASLGTGADWDSGSISIDVLAEHLPAAVELTAELVREADFPEEEVARALRRRVNELRRRAAQPGLVAGDALAAELFAGTVFELPLIGSEETVASLSRDAAAGFHARHATPRGATLIASGDVEIGELRGLLENALGDWQAGPSPEPEPFTAPARASTTVTVIDRPGAAQTELRMGHAAVPRNHPDFLHLQVLNALAGGKFTSRINLNLRERHSWTYGAHSYLTGRRACGIFVVSTAVDNAAAGGAVSETIGELERLREELVADDELRDTRQYLVGVFPYRLETIQGLAAHLEDTAVYGLPEDYWRRYPDRVMEVDAERVRELARDHLRPRELAVVAVGPAAEIAPQLEAVGPVTVVENPAP